jgi:hypothetical protein
MLEIATPLEKMDQVNRIRCGDLIVNPDTGKHWFLREGA